jgi:hypothetical protein
MVFCKKLKRVHPLKYRFSHKYYYEFKQTMIYIKLYIIIYTLLGWLGLGGIRDRDKLRVRVPVFEEM